MVVTCSASAISRSVNVAKFAAAVVMNALIRSGCSFAYPSPTCRSIVLIATFKASSVISNALYFGSVLSLRVLVICHLNLYIYRNMCGLCGLLGYLSVLTIFYPFISACCKTPYLLFAHHITRKTLKITRKRGFFCGLRMTVRCYFSYSPAGYNRAFAGYKCPFAGYVRVIDFLYIHALNTLIHRITRITRNFFPHTGD
ncbi:putative membrane protein [Escherichia coli 07798]|nr:putative membrane protein [Escherichia coli 07798]